LSNGLPDFDKIKSEAGDKLEKIPGRRTLSEFKTFLLRGNVVDLAVAVAVGAAFTQVVQAFVSDFITPLIALPGATQFKDLEIPIGDQHLYYGHFLDTLIAFVITAAVVFLCVVKPINHLMERRKSETDKVEENRVCPECLSKIPMAARRCAFCTAEVEPVA